MPSTFPATLPEVQEAVRVAPRLSVRGGGTKSALGVAQEASVLNLSRLSGILEYSPNEFVFTALAGTRLSEVQLRLAEHGQYLPFDPLFITQGATLGGTVAAGLSGPGRYRFGGVRDFILGVRFVDGCGAVVRGGGKVVKNAAGFDLPKLMVGSLGRLGALVETTFKVFPCPAAYATLRVVDSFENALQKLQQLFSAPLDLEALELIPAPDSTTLLMRIGGLPATLPERLRRLQHTLGAGEVVSEADEAQLWQAARVFEWMPAGWSLVKIPLTPGRIVALEKLLVPLPVPTLRRYSAGGQLAWVALSGTPSVLDHTLLTLGLSGLVVLGVAESKKRLGMVKGAVFYERVRQVLDPENKFV